MFGLWERCERHKLKLCATAVAFVLPMSYLGYVIGSLALRSYLDARKLTSIPGPPPDAFLTGHVDTIRAEEAMGPMVLWARKYGYAVKYRLLGDWRIGLNHPKDVHFVATHFLLFDKHDISAYGSLRRILGDQNLVSMEDENMHTRIRSIISPAFTSGALRELAATIFRTEASLLCDMIAAAAIASCEDGRFGGSSLDSDVSNASSILRWSSTIGASEDLGSGRQMSAEMDSSSQVSGVVDFGAHVQQVALRIITAASFAIETNADVVDLARAPSPYSFLRMGTRSTPPATPASNPRAVAPTFPHAAVVSVRPRRAGNKPDACAVVAPVDVAIISASFQRMLDHNKLGLQTMLLQTFPLLRHVPFLSAIRATSVAHRQVGGTVDAVLDYLTRSADLESDKRKVQIAGPDSPGVVPSSYSGSHTSGDFGVRAELPACVDERAEPRGSLPKTQESRLRRAQQERRAGSGTGGRVGRENESQAARALWASGGSGQAGTVVPGGGLKKRLGSLADALDGAPNAYDLACLTAQKSRSPVAHRKRPSVHGTFDGAAAAVSSRRLNSGGCRVAEWEGEPARVGRSPHPPYESRASSGDAAVRGLRKQLEKSKSLRRGTGASSSVPRQGLTRTSTVGDLGSPESLARAGAATRLDFGPSREEGRRALSRSEAGKRSARALFDPVGSGRRTPTLRPEDSDSATGLLMRQLAEGLRSAKLTAKVARDQVLTMIFAGHETTSTALSWALALLALPENSTALVRARRAAVQFEAHYEERNRDESLAGWGISRVPFGSAAKGGVNSRSFTPEEAHAVDDAVQSGRHLISVCLEVLRLRPPVPFVLRRSTKEVTLPSGTVIPSNMMVTLWIYNLHHDAAWGTDVDTFDPSRWDVVDGVPELKYYYAPFLHGKRNCVGRHFALKEFSTVLAAVLARFDVAYPVGATLPRKQLRVTMKPEGELKLVFTARGA